jgi:hypothetical protein
MITKSYLYVWSIFSMAMLVGPIGAQEQIQWLVNNTQSPTVIPLYANQESPFSYRPDPHKFNIDQAQAQLQAQVSMRIAQIQQMVQSQRALQPDISSLQIQAIIQGPMGPRVLMRNEWLKQGQTVQVPSQATPSYQIALQQLRQLQPNAPDPMASSYQNITLNLEKIERQGITLTGASQPLFIPFRQE